MERASRYRVVTKLAIRNLRPERVGKETDMKHKILLGIRMVVFLGLIALSVKAFKVNPDVADVIFFASLVFFWFSGSLLIDILFVPEGRILTLRNAIFGMVDVYIFVAFLADISDSGIVLLYSFATYVMVIAGLEGLTVGGVVTAAGVFAAIQWCMKGGGFNLSNFFLFIVAGVASLIGGIAAHYCIPLLWKMIHGSHHHLMPAAPLPESASTRETALHKKIEDMQKLMDNVSAERDEAQEQVSELEEKLHKLEVGNNSVGTGSDTNAGVDERIKELEKKLEETDTLLKAAEHDKTKLTEEVENLSKELEASYMNAEQKEIA